jgi:hypothetical protein
MVTGTTTRRKRGKIFVKALYISIYQANNFETDSIGLYSAGTEDCEPYAPRRGSSSSEISAARLRPADTTIT